MSSLWLLLAVVPSIILHEVSHGLVANYFGDPTAKEQGRLTLNPLVHIDPFGSIVLPLIMVVTGLPPFGYAKPVPVTIGRLRNPRRNSFWVSLAGPAVNIVLSGLGLFLCWLYFHGLANFTVAQAGLYIGLPNLTLALINLIPIPPLDGSAIIERFIPQRSMGTYYALRARALPIVMVLFIVDSLFTHVASNVLSHVANWWYSLSQR